MQGRDLLSAAFLPLTTPTSDTVCGAFMVAWTWSDALATVTVIAGIPVNTCAAPRLGFCSLIKSHAHGGYRQKNDDAREYYSHILSHLLSLRYS